MLQQNLFVSLIQDEKLFFKLHFNLFSSFVDLVASPLFKVLPSTEVFEEAQLSQDAIVATSQYPVVQWFVVLWSALVVRRDSFFRKCIEPFWLLFVY